MRMWMTDPKTMCRKHLLGEHNELHMILGSLKKGIQLSGYVRNNCLELKSLSDRHTAVADEMTARGFNHKSPFPDQQEIDALSKYLPGLVLQGTVDRDSSTKDLSGRCTVCEHMRSLIEFKRRIIVETPKKFSISGYWKDDKTPIENYIVTSTMELLREDEEIFMYGLTAEELASMVQRGEDTEYDFVVTSWEEV